MKGSRRQDQQEDKTDARNPAVGPGAVQGRESANTGAASGPVQGRELPVSLEEADLSDELEDEFEVGQVLAQPINL